MKLFDEMKIEELEDRFEFGTRCQANDNKVDTK